MLRSFVPICGQFVLALFRQSLPGLRHLEEARFIAGIRCVLG